MQNDQPTEAGGHHPAAWPVAAETAQYRDTIRRLEQLGYDVDDIDHLDVDDVVMPLGMFTRLVGDLAGYRAQSFDAAEVAPR